MPSSLRDVYICPKHIFVLFYPAFFERFTLADFGALLAYYVLASRQPMI